MTPDLSDTKVLRYRTNAVTLGRASDSACKMLETLQAGREVERDVPRPSIAAAPPAAKPIPAASAPLGAAKKAPTAGESPFPRDGETMKRWLCLPKSAAAPPFCPPPKAPGSTPKLAC